MSPGTSNDRPTAVQPTPRDMMTNRHTLPEPDLGLLSAILLSCDGFVSANLNVIVLYGLYVYNY